MSFLNPSYLWVLPAGLIPIIIYYLMRYRSLRVDWGANYVLERALERLRKKLYLDQIILLALRVLACLAIVLAFARPASRSKSATVTGTGVHHVLLVDPSYSQLAGPEGSSRWERATETMRQLVSTWGRGETWSLYVMGREPGWRVEGRTVASAADSRAVIDEIGIEEASSSLSKAMEAVAEKFPAGENVEVFVFADDQASTWEQMDRIAPPTAGEASVYWVNPPIESRGNLAVTSVQFSHERVLVDHPVRVFASVRNFGDEPVSDAPAEVLIDGAFYAREAVSLLPGQEGWISFDTRFDEPGAHYVTVRLGDDALTFDNSMSAGVKVSEAFDVLVLRDENVEEKFASAWGFLEILGRIEEMTAEDDEPLFTMGPLRLSLCEGECPAERLETADVVLLDGGRTLDAALAAKLKAFVADGGGLVLAAGENVNPARWNELLSAAGLLPAPLERARVESIGGERYASLARSEFELPAMRAFETLEDGDIANAKFYSWYEFGEPAPETEVLMRLADRTPFLLRRREGLGSVLLMGSGLSGRGNNLIVREFYFPLVFALFSEAASGGVYPRTVPTGETIRVRVTDTTGVKGMTFDLPGAQAAVPLDPQEVDGELRASAVGGSPVTGLASVLVVRAGGSERVWYGVQGRRVDSDIRAVDAAALARAAERLNITEAADWRQLDETLRAQRRGAEWHHWAMIALLALLIGEMLMQRRFI